MLALARLWKLYSVNAMSIKHFLSQLTSPDRDAFVQLVQDLLDETLPVQVKSIEQSIKSLQTESDKKTDTVRDLESKLAIIGRLKSIAEKSGGDGAVVLVLVLSEEASRLEHEIESVKLTRTQYQLIEKKKRRTILGVQRKAATSWQREMENVNQSAS